ncbi:MAG: hypothetical protein FJ027_13025 [Candidatus Rokubacteria bacterium]|nr:hypothetical protein [Candidatus Rokubacteria bacterium]
MTRRIVVTVCPRESGVVVMPVERGGRRRRLSAAAILAELQGLVARRGLEAHVRVRDACAGGCNFPGPNVSVTVHPPVRPGEAPDHVAIAWKSYVGSLRALDCLARVIDDNLRD